MADCSISSFDLGKPQPEGKTPGQPSSYFDMLMKMLIVGNSSVGKTNLLNRLAGQRFCNSYVSTIGLDFKVKSIQVKDRVVKLQMWDTAGQERFRTLTKTYYQAASIVLVVFSVNDRESVEYTESWLKQIDELCGQEVRKILVANKLDIAESDRLVSSQQIGELAKKFSIPCIEISAKTGTGLPLLQQTINDEAKIILEALTNSQIVASTKFKRNPLRSCKVSKKSYCC